MIDTAALKNNILELAFKGELVSKVEGDGCISDLIDTIPNPSNKRLGLLKKGSDTVFPYDLPDNWKIVPLGRITSYGDTPKKTIASDVSSDTWILELEDIESGGRLLKKTRVDSRQAIGEKTTFNCGQVLYSKLRPYLKKVLQADEDGICTPELIAFDVYAGINPRYVMYYLICNFVDKVINQRSYGVKMPRVDAQFMVNLPVPLPTIAVQNKIVDIIDEAFSAVEKINEYQAQYSSDIEVLKSKIIDAGIQGKLTEQLPEDGTAEELLEQIAEEKKMHVKEGKIKASKSLPEITEDEIPFEIPDNWKWCRLVDLCKEITDGTHKTPTYIETGVPFLSVKNVSSGHFDFEDVKYISESEHRELIKRCNPEKGDILICRIGTLGKAIEIDINVNFSIFVSLGLIKPLDSYLSKYLVYVLNSGFGEKWIKKNKAGDAMHAAKINLDVLRSFLVPLPPLLEQTRIVDKIDEMLSIVQR